jgi:hypothetical protein
MDAHALNQFNVIDNDDLFAIQGGGWLGIIGGVALIVGGAILCGTGVGSIVGGKATLEGGLLVITGVASMIGGAVAIDQSN